MRTKRRPLLGPEEWTVENCGHETPCWVWKGSLNNKGYAVVGISGKRTYAHRAMYEQEVGPIPEGFDLDHLCRVTACVRPSHTEPVPHAVNIQRGRNAKLSAEDVRAIRDDSRSHAAVAAEYGVSASHVLRIRRGEKWKVSA